MISVIIPVFNRAVELERALSSVFNQTYKDFEVIVVDDGSSDESAHVASKFDVQLVQQENLGVSAARNRGIEISNGEYIAFLDSDDEWLPTKLEAQNKYNSACIHTEEIWIRNGKRVNQMKKHQKGGGDQFIPSLDLCLISPSSVMIRRDVFERIGLFREDYPVCEDYDLWLKLTSLYEVDFIEEPQILKYGGHKDQLSRKFKAMDYWRVKSLIWVLENRELSSKRREAVLAVLKTKTEILIKGYRKHGHENKTLEMETIKRFYFS
ncbi:MAG: glycosyl transferase [Halobacteriovoraceae bacterium]|nr:glycosyl transferase [Halobacteriovoraceae bacterium]|tara:strand:+ start:11636 stop:12433 length:798 start_codon:yes stop_codon:yes gene_type:complete